jgi:pimeloyl-ACP methyl ester carboxylesterase
MMGEFTRVITKDGIELHGLYCPVETDKPVVLHFHGLAGNFYENRFVDSLANALNDRGFGFLTANNRGHDYLSDFIRLTSAGVQWVQIGAAHELFEECVLDIEAWLDFLSSRGHGSIALQGHSSGAAKVVYYLSQKQDSRVKSIILLSPSDDVGLQRQSLGDRFEEALATARGMLSEGRGDQLMPTGYFDYPIDAKTYLNMFGPETKNGVFDFSSSSRTEFVELAAVQCPILAVLGSVREAVVGDVGEFLVHLRAYARRSAHCATHVVAGAPHNYMDHEDRIAELVTDWVAKLV